MDFLAPCHYRQNGETVVDQKIMEYGCGQYDASAHLCKQELENADFCTEVREDCKDGSNLKCTSGKKSLYLCADNAVIIDYFSFDNEKHQSRMEPSYANLGQGGYGELIIPYSCTTEPVHLKLYINDLFSQEVTFPVIGNEALRKSPAQKRVPVSVDGGMGGMHHLEIRYCREELGTSTYDLEINNDVTSSIFLSTGGRT